MNTGDTAWLLTATALVLFMTLPGLALFYAGLVRGKNALSMIEPSSHTSYWKVWNRERIREAPWFLAGCIDYGHRDETWRTARLVSESSSLNTDARGAIVPSMPVTPEELAERAMDLPAESRAQLADLLVESLDGAQLSKIDQAWAAEAKRRRDEMRSGKAKTIPASEALRQVRDALER